MNTSRAVQMIVEGYAEPRDAEDVGVRRVGAYLHFEFYHASLTEYYAGSVKDADDGGLVMEIVDGPDADGDPVSLTIHLRDEADLVAAIDGAVNAIRAIQTARHL